MTRRAMGAGSFDTVLIANRGEIAMRVMRTARALGLRTVAVYSDADAGLPYVLAADRAVRIGPAPARESYLSIDRILEAARMTGARAVHPGYGFLSESEDFAAACRKAGLVFIGPSAAAIRAMGNKALAKRIMRDCEVPCIPGYDRADQSDETLLREATRIGWPIVVKAVAGGGGKGMRLVTGPAQFPEALRAVRSEAIKAFGDGALMLEKAISGARHIEVQVFGDAAGRVVYLGDRDCSVQRRHQKIIEEAPAPGLTDVLRARMGEAAVKAARAVRYEGAGTVEFLLTPRGDFHFLEMNTRLQVEHPVTECVTGLDLVEWQFRVAAGEPLPLEQSQIRLRGHAVEARVYAEDPAAEFLPQCGRLLTWRPPDVPGVRVDHGLCEGATVSTHYDPMMAKVIAHAPERELALRKLVAAIEGFAVGGVRNNLAFLRECLAHPDFVAGGVDTAFLDRNAFKAVRGGPPDRQLVATAALLFHCRAVEGMDRSLRGWHSRPWRAEALALACGDWRTTVQVSSDVPGTMLVVDGAGTTEVALLAAGPAGRVRIDGVDRTMHWAWDDDALHLVCDATYACFTHGRESEATRDLVGPRTIVAPMPGSIVDVRVEAGAKVRAGDVLLILEAMKLEHQIQAPVSGSVTALCVAMGQQVGVRDVLLEIEGEEAPQA